MGYLIQFQINVFAVVVLAILYFFIHKSKIKTFSRHLIDWLLVTTAIAIVDEPLTWIFDRMLFPGAYFLEYATNFLLYLIGPVIGGLLMSYVDYRMFQDRNRIYKRGFYQHASLLTFIVLIVNFLIPLYFSVDPVANSYSSGDFKVFHYIVLGLLYGYFILFVFTNKKKISRKEALLYQVFFFIPIAGMALQLLDSKLHLSWTSIALAILVIYVFLESTPSDEDYLTKLYNRNSFDTFIQYLIQGKKQFCLIVFDLNYFKEINDRYGHEAGDETLIIFARTLKQTFSPSGLSFRLGGDEFAAVFPSDDVDAKIEAMRNLLGQYTDPLISTLSFSYGYQKFTTGMSADELSRKADHRMYERKKMIKSQV